MRMRRSPFRCWLPTIFSLWVAVALQAAGEPAAANGAAQANSAVAAENTVPVNDISQAAVAAQENRIAQANGAAQTSNAAQTAVAEQANGISQAGAEQANGVAQTSGISQAANNAVQAGVAEQAAGSAVGLAGMEQAAGSASGAIAIIEPVDLATAIAAEGLAMMHTPAGFLPVADGAGASQSVLNPGFERLLGAVVRIDVWETSFADGIRSTQRGFGSGAIVNAEGYILTNAHVVTPYVERMMVTLNSLERVPAKLVGWDHWTDLAVVRLDMEDVKARKLHFTHAQFGDSAALQPGQTVYAVGTPNGLSRTVTRGIISNTTRFFEGRTVGEGYETGYFNTWLQTDAAINPGNSGGPLALPDGRIIGINTRAYLGANNLAFAVPSDIARDVLQKLIANGKIGRSYIGLLPGAMQDLENFFHLKVNQGVLVQSIDPGSPADKAGLRPGDILMTVDGVAVDGRFPEQLPAIQQRIASVPVGGKVALELSRGGKPFAVSIVTEPLQSRVGEMQAFGQWGLSVQKISLAVAREEQLRSADGVRVMGVQSGFPAAEAGVQRGDIIVAVNSEPLQSLEQLQGIYENYQKTPQRIMLELVRNRQAVYLMLRPR